MGDSSTTAVPPQKKAGKNSGNLLYISGNYLDLGNLLYIVTLNLRPFWEDSRTKPSFEVTSAEVVMNFPDLDSRVG